VPSPSAVHEFSSSIVRRAKPRREVPPSSPLDCAPPLSCRSHRCGGVEGLASRVRDATGGRVHALVHLAGRLCRERLRGGQRPRGVGRQFAINTTTAYLTARAFIPLLRGTRGAIVFFGSEAALPGARVAGISGYAAAKTAVLSLAQAIARKSATTACAPTRSLPRRSARLRISRKWGLMPRTSRARQSPTWYSGSAPMRLARYRPDRSGAVSVPPVVLPLATSHSSLPT
jgi:NAD(P)-dependent dehydrogenase (short-subunit alcohol dehydrogenase family)